VGVWLGVFEKNFDDLNNPWKGNGKKPGKQEDLVNEFSNCFLFIY